ncbi:MAG: hypothetical protein V4793_05940 [Paraburkholderia tropica]|uniref:hypothetical protein n=1 Tax=Paraburkholderia tropica TaxID=92647 RepID=UPI003101B2F0
MMSSDPRRRNSSAEALPAGILGRDYLKFLQLSADDALTHVLDNASLENAITAICSGAMRSARPPMKVFFDGCRFWLASHFHRYEAARRLGANHQEFWCDIEPGSRDHARRYDGRQR